MDVNKTKFERNISQQYDHMTCIEKKNIQAKEVYWDPNFPSLWFYSQYFEPPRDVTAAMLVFT